jgi:glycosyltransferase involved in cell wall biosynthesis
MTKLGLRPYGSGDAPSRGSVPVSIVVLSRDEEANIGQCLASVKWADQIVVLDSGSSDKTVPIARSLGADVIEQSWLGFSAQREFALRQSVIRHDWVYFVDADQWISPQLAAEVAIRIQTASCVAFSQRLRLVFQGTWIRHCGWYGGSWNVQLMDRRYAKYDGSILGERVCVDGPIERLDNDIVDDDGKGLAAWLHKHVRYAQLEAECRGPSTPLPERVRALRYTTRGNSRPLARAVLKDVLFPSVPAKPVTLFLYMYLMRLGVLDGRAGLRFCFYHAWYEATVAAIRINAVAAK